MCGCVHDRMYVCAIRFDSSTLRRLLPRCTMPSPPTLCTRTPHPTLPIRALRTAAGTTSTPKGKSVTGASSRTHSSRRISSTSFGRSSARPQTAAPVVVQGVATRAIPPPPPLPPPPPPAPPPLPHPLPPLPRPRPLPLPPPLSPRTALRVAVRWMRLTVLRVGRGRGTKAGGSGRDE